MFFIISRLIFLHSIRFNNKFDFVSNKFSILVIKGFIHIFIREDDISFFLSRLSPLHKSNFQKSY